MVEVEVYRGQGLRDIDGARDLLPWPAECCGARSREEVRRAGTTQSLAERPSEADQRERFPLWSAAALVLSVGTCCQAGLGCAAAAGGRSCLRRILPTGVLGKASWRNSICLGTL